MAGKHLLSRPPQETQKTPEPRTVEIVGVLLEQDPLHVVLSNGTTILLRQGVTASHIPIGRSITISCTIDHDLKIAEAIRLNPDWLIEAAEQLDLDD